MDLFDCSEKNLLSLVKKKFILEKNLFKNLVRIQRL